MERLRLTTKTRFYERYRQARLKEMGIIGSDGAEQSLRCEARGAAALHTSFLPLARLTLRIFFVTV